MRKRSSGFSSPRVSSSSAARKLQRNAVRCLLVAGLLAGTGLPSGYGRPAIRGLSVSASVPVSQEAGPEGEGDRRLEAAIERAIEGEYDGALALLQPLIAEHPDDARLYYYAGVCLFFDGRLDQAIEALEAAVERRASFPQAYYWLAKADFEKGRDGEACRALGRGLEAFPANEKLRILRESSQLRCLSADATD